MISRHKTWSTLSNWRVVISQISCVLGAKKFFANNLHIEFWYTSKPISSERKLPVAISFWTQNGITKTILEDNIRFVRKFCFTWIRIIELEKWINKKRMLWFCLEPTALLSRQVLKICVLICWFWLFNLNQNCCLYQTNMKKFFFNF